MSTFLLIACYSSKATKPKRLSATGEIHAGFTKVFTQFVHRISLCFQTFLISKRVRVTVYNKQLVRLIAQFC